MGKYQKLSVCMDKKYGTYRQSPVEDLHVKREDGI